jgi:hypothetical protein
VSLVISTRESGDVTILDLRGRSTIDPGENELLDRHLQELMADRIFQLLLNLADLIQIDSSGLSVIDTTYIPSPPGWRTEIPVSAWPAFWKCSRYCICFELSQALRMRLKHRQVFGCGDAVHRRRKGWFIS